MNNENSYQIKDISLAPEGRQRISWARANMPILCGIGEHFAESRPFENLKISICLHVEAKTAVWLEVLQAGGAEIAVTGSPGTTQDDTAAALVADQGIHVFSRRDESFEDHLSYCRSILSFGPDLIADNGGDMHRLLAEDPLYKETASNMLGATEETTTGARLIREEIALLNFPTLVINDTEAKRLIENRYGVGSSVVDGLMRATNIMLHGKAAIVIGYGFCGSGVAQRLRGMGAHVTVVDASPMRRLEAHLEGFNTADLADALPSADMVITVTGHPGILKAEQFELMKDGALIANAGHFASEVDVAALKGMASEVLAIREKIDAYALKGGKTIYLAADANPINLAAGDGNPIEVMDLGLAMQALSLAKLAGDKTGLEIGPQCVPRDIEDEVARRALESWVT